MTRKAVTGTDGPITLPYASAFIPVGKDEKVYVDVVDQPKHNKFSDTPENKKLVGVLKDTIKQSFDTHVPTIENNLENSFDPKIREQYKVLQEKREIQTANKELVKLNHAERPLLVSNQKLLLI
ncbi:hypothetical protein AB3N60_15510 [Leptospira sp. WS39.C2]